jgi:hypothetical protein
VGNRNHKSGWGFAIVRFVQENPSAYRFNFGIQLNSDDMIYIKSAIPEAIIRTNKQGVEIEIMKD